MSNLAELIPSPPPTLLKKYQPPKTIELQDRDHAILALIEREHTTVTDVVQAMIKIPRSYLYDRIRRMATSGHLKRYQLHNSSEQLLLHRNSPIPRKPIHRRNISITSACVQLALREHPTTTFEEADIFELPSALGMVRPDRTFYLKLKIETDYERQFYVLEDDEGTEGIEEFAFKCARYWAFWDEQCFQPLLAAKRNNQDWPGNRWGIDNLRILTTVPDDKQLDRLMRAARRGIAKTSNGTARGLGLYWFKVRPFTNADRRSRQAALAGSTWILNGWRTLDGKEHSLLE